jgi:hypothetical protein
LGNYLVGEVVVKKFSWYEVASAIETLAVRNEIKKKEDESSPDAERKIIQLTKGSWLA